MTSYTATYRHHTVLVLLRSVPSWAKRIDFINKNNSRVADVSFRKDGFESCLSLPKNLGDYFSSAQGDNVSIAFMSYCTCD
jgi:hypothetical protein